MTHRRTPALLLLAVALAVGGCSKDETRAEEKKPDPMAGAVAVAKEYQLAAMKPDWHRACELRTVAYRFGKSVDECAADNVVPTPPPVGTASPSTSPQPDRAELGPLRLEDGPLPVPSIGDHPAGIGVMFAYDVKWPTEASITRKAVRVVKENGVWRVEQRETVHDTDIAHGNPLYDALTRPQQ
ncbi:hypothetical protein [Streptomyces sp. NPDC089919]|uniref:hypothetical protein n=1 Tax=Streptomyces sp. NPDC089919 TaxID=3155188 RepID=UPI00341C186D